MLWSLQENNLYNAIFYSHEDSKFEVLSWKQQVWWSYNLSSFAFPDYHLSFLSLENLLLVILMTLLCNLNSEVQSWSSLSFCSCLSPHPDVLIITVRIIIFYLCLYWRFLFCFQCCYVPVRGHAQHDFGVGKRVDTLLCCILKMGLKRYYHFI